MNDIKRSPELAPFPSGHPISNQGPWQSPSKPKTLLDSSKSKGKDNGKGKGNSKSQGTGKGEKLGSSSTRLSISIFLRDMMDLVRNSE
jgi:hypothetical protein